jgi:hypothetical protein
LANDGEGQVWAGANEALETLGRDDEQHRALEGYRGGRVRGVAEQCHFAE